MNFKMSLCDPKAARMTYLKVGDAIVGLQNLDVIAKAVQGLKLQQMEDIKRELLCRVKLLNYIPDSVNEKYAAALWEYYKSYDHRWVNSDIKTND
ncbi:hypothetical protein JCM14036_31160 [Desulfotomaculum defluvii]